MLKEALILQKYLWSGWVWFDGIQRASGTNSSKPGTWMKGLALELEAVS